MPKKKIIPKLSKKLAHTGTGKGKSPIKVENSKSPVMGAGSPELKAHQKMFGFNDEKRRKKMIKTEKKRKVEVKYAKVIPQ